MAKRMAVLVGMLAVVLGALLAAPVPAAMAQEEEEEGGTAPAGTVTATGVLARGPSDGGPPVFFVTDEASGQRYFLDNEGPGADYGAYEGERVIVEGVPRADRNTGFGFLTVGGIRPADGGPPPGTPPGPAPQDRTATFSFELTVRGTPPEGARFFGAVPAEGCISAPLSDPDGDGVFTGSVDVPRFAPGPVPPGTPPVELPVQIARADGGVSPCDPAGVIRDFGIVPANDDTFKARVNLREGRGETTAPESTTPETTAPSSPGSGSSGSGSSGSDAKSGGTPSGGEAEIGGGGTAKAGGAPKEAAGAKAGAESEAKAGLKTGAKAEEGKKGKTENKAEAKNSEKKELPKTGGAGGTPLLVLGAGALLVGGGLLARRLVR